MRKIGVEEELMLVDPDTGKVTAVAAAALRAREDAAERGEAAEEGAPVDQELFLQQIETATAPCTSAEELTAELVRGRRAVGESARAAGAAAVAVPTPVLPSDEPTITPKQRYRRIRDEYGEMTRQALVCGMHMHIDVSGEDEAIRVMDGIRPWLPVLLAMSGNSPFWEGRDTCFASWRSQVWGRWPSSGPAEPFGTPETYRSTVGKMIEWGASVDEGMLYLDVRPSSSYPTIEIRVTDVCTEVEDAVLVSTSPPVTTATPGEATCCGRRRGARRGTGCRRRSSTHGPWSSRRCVTSSRRCAPTPRRRCARAVTGSGPRSRSSACSPRAPAPLDSARRTR